MQRCGRCSVSARTRPACSSKESNEGRCRFRYCTVWRYTGRSASIPSTCTSGRSRRTSSTTGRPDCRPAASSPSPRSGRSGASSRKAGTGRSWQRSSPCRSGLCGSSRLTRPGPACPESPFSNQRQSRRLPSDGSWCGWGHRGVTSTLCMLYQNRLGARFFAARDRAGLQARHTDMNPLLGQDLASSDSIDSTESIKSF